MFATIAALIPAYLIGFIVQFILLFSNFVVTAAVAFLEYTMSDNFIRISYTQMTGDYANPIIAIGWPLLRDLVNMGFLIMIIVIGIATSLRIQEYQAQKTLLPLLMIAFLINFSPVIIGVIVDASNILMNFFLDGVSGIKIFQSRMAAQVSVLQNALRGFSNPLVVISAVSQGIALTVSNFISALMYVIFGFLFIVRRLAIWILVILSPVAFASYIFPSTRGFWSSWWRQLMQWCFIGVTAGFFLYLSNQLMMNITALQISAPPGSGVIETFVASMVPGIVSVAFMMFGLMTGFSTSAMGASAVINFTKKNASRASSWSRTKTASKLRGIPAVSRAEGKLMRSLEGIPLVGGAIGGRGAYDSRLAKRAGEARTEVKKILASPDGIKHLQRRISSKGATDKGLTQLDIEAINELSKAGKLPTDSADLTRVRKDAAKASMLGHNMDDFYNAHPEWKSDLSKVNRDYVFKWQEKENKSIEAVNITRTASGLAPLPLVTIPTGWKGDEKPMDPTDMGNLNVARRAAHLPSIGEDDLLTYKKFDDVSEQMKGLKGQKVLDLEPDVFKDQGIVAGLTDSHAGQLVSAVAGDQMRQINETIRKMTMWTSSDFKTMFAPPLPSGGKTSKISNDLLNYIVTQQAANKWPI